MDNNELFGTWDTIAKAVCATIMSRSINIRVILDNYFCIAVS